VRALTNSGRGIDVIRERVGGPWIAAAAEDEDVDGGEGEGDRRRLGAEVEVEDLYCARGIEVSFLLSRSLLIPDNEVSRWSFEGVPSRGVSSGVSSRIGPADNSVVIDPRLSKGHHYPRNFVL